MSFWKKNGKGCTIMFTGGKNNQKTRKKIAYKFWKSCIPTNVYIHHSRISLIMWSGSKARQDIMSIWRLADQDLADFLPKLNLPVLKCANVLPRFWFRSHNQWNTRMVYMYMFIRTSKIHILTPQIKIKIFTSHILYKVINCLKSFLQNRK